MRTTTLLRLAVLFLLAAPPLQAARDQLMNRGFNAGSVYAFSEVDAVNSFSGNVTATIPLGRQYESSGTLKYQFHLVYNSSVWDFVHHSASGGPQTNDYRGLDFQKEFEPFDDSGGPPSEPGGSGIEAIPARNWNAGMGWMVTLGELRTKMALNGVPQVVYIAADGSEHSFYSSLHGLYSDVQTATGRYYTRDSSYIRMIVQNANQREIQLPDGIRQRFECVADCGKFTGQWILRDMSDPHGNLLTVTRTVGGTPRDQRPAPSGQANWLWTFTEYFSPSEGYKSTADAGGLLKIREHKLWFRVTLSATWVSEVRLELLQLAAQGAGDAEYRLAYRDQNILRDRNSSWWESDPSKDGVLYPATSSAAKDRITVSLLDAVELPPKSGQSAPSGKWRMKYWGDGCAFPTTSACDAHPFTSKRLWGSAEYQVNDVFGRLKDLVYPTGNGMRYEYELRGYPHQSLCAQPPSPGPNPAPNAGAFTRLVGVVRRQRIKSIGNGNHEPDGLPWLYFGRSWAVVRKDCNPWEFVTAVVEPPNVTAAQYQKNVSEGKATPAKVTVSFHSLYVKPAADVRWTVREHGLPITHMKERTLENVTHGLSRQIYSCNVGTFLTGTPVALDAAFRKIVEHNLIGTETTTTCGAPLRSVWVAYEDSGGQCDPDDLGACANANRRELASVTEYHAVDDKFSTAANPVYTFVQRSDFDGLGNYRRTLTGGTFASRSGAPGQDRRTSYTRYNDGIVYNRNNQTITEPSEWWILGTSTESFVTQDGASNVRRTQYEPTTGFLLAERTLKNQTPVDNHNQAQNAGADLLRVRKRTLTSGQAIITEYFYGGDTPSQQLPGPGTFTPPGGWEYAIEKTWRAGTLQKTAYKGKCDSPGDTVIETNAIDDESGLVVSSTDEGGAVTGYAYDAMGRLTSIDPPGDEVPYLYTYPNLVDGEKIVSMSRSGGQSGSWEYDGYGRIVFERTNMPGGASMVETQYTMTGLKSQVSSRIKDGPNSNGDGVNSDYHYDIFGRPVKVVPPNGGPEKVSYEYQGDRETKKTQSGVVVAAYRSRVDVSTVESYDSHRRLVRVDENAAPNGGSVILTTKYEYDMADRLVGVNAPAGGNTKRTFTYDGRGVMTAEQHPELPGKTLQHSRFDARGNARERFLTPAEAEGKRPFDVLFSYDESERLVAVVGFDGPSPLKSFSYVNGRLKSASRVNHVPKAHATAQGQKVSVITTFDYYPATGKVWKKTLDAGLKTTVTYTYDTRGQVSTIQYPRVQLQGCAPLGPDRTIQLGYNMELPASVTQTVPGTTAFISGISYHFNGMPSVVTRGNQTEDVMKNDPGALPRPAEISVRRQGTLTGLWSTGGYVYDGVGSPEQIGADLFHYDRYGRLTGARVGTPIDSKILVEQSFQYDVSGNMKTMITNGAATAISVSATSNRLNAPAALNESAVKAAYDGAGNITRYRDPRRASFEAAYTWDALNVMTGAEGYKLKSDGTKGDVLFGRVNLYDANDERVAVWDYGSAGMGSAPTIVEQWSVRGLGNEVLRDFSRARAPQASCGEWSWTKDYVYNGPRAIAAVLPAGIQHYHHDHLGTVRYITDAAGNFVDQRKYLPFGEEMNARPDPNRIKYTGHERDDDGSLSAVGDTDYMHARHYAGVAGRFLSVDPVLGTPALPNSWNAYAYVRNNPLRLTDPSGRADPEKEQKIVEVNALREFVGIHVGPLEVSYSSRKLSETIAADGQSFSTTYEKEYTLGIGKKGMGVGVVKEDVVQYDTTVQKGGPVTTEKVLSSHAGPMGGVALAPGKHGHGPIIVGGAYGRKVEDVKFRLELGLGPGIRLDVNLSALWRALSAPPPTPQQNIPQPNVACQGMTCVNASTRRPFGG